MRYKFLRFPGGKPKAVTFSYDDGVREDIQLVEIINRHGIKCTFNLNNDILRGENNFTSEEINKYFLSDGHEVAVHGSMHRALGNVSAIDGIRDVLECRLELEKKTGKIIKGMAYPDTGITVFVNNASYESIKSYLKDLGIVYSRTLGGDNNSFQLPQDWYAWMPTAHHNNPQIMEYIDEFVNMDLSTKTYCARRQPRLFYMWGHSYEFRNADNWEHLEEICAKLGGKDDTWYATNMEIHDYVEAYNSLVYSADGRKVYNPTLIRIWVDVDGVLYDIAPGETKDFE
ncbi:MAG: polysaccharide deacetylase family protein [Clostridia bacterium]|nr:polysaccharide deacetylase family protein [Clostridia bacterium]